MEKLFNNFLENIVKLTKQDSLFGDVFHSIYEIQKEHESQIREMVILIKILLGSNALIFVMLILERSPK